MQTEPTTTIPETTDAPTGDAPGQQPNSGETGVITFQSEAELQAYIERVLKERLEREARKRERAAEEARRRAEEEAMARNAEWERLAEERERRIAELEPQAQAAERYKAALETLLAEQRKGLPEHIITLLDRLDPVDQLEYLATNRDKLAPPSSDGGIPATPKSAGELSFEERVQREIAAQRARRGRFG